MAKGKHGCRSFAPLTMLDMLNDDDSSSDDYGDIPGKHFPSFIRCHYRGSVK